MEEYLFRIVQRVTVTVKTFPFFYALGLMIFWLVAPALSLATIEAIDKLILLSVVMVLFLVRLSYCVKLCIWHRLQCVLPLLPQISAQVDKHIIFGLYLAITNDTIITIIFILSLINAYFVFIKPAVKK